MPITVRRQLPTARANATVMTSSTLVASTITTVNGRKYIVFGATPGQGEMRLVKVVVLAANAPTTQVMLVETCPNPFVTKSTVAVKGTFSFFSYSLDGKRVEIGQGVDAAKSGSSLLTRTYVLKVRHNDKIISSMVVKK